MAFTDIPVAGQDVLGTTLDALITELRPVHARVTSDQTLTPSSTTLQDVTAIAVPVVANAVYRFSLDFQYTTTTAADIKIGWTVPSGTTMDWGSLGWSIAEGFQALGGFTSASVPGYGGTGSYVYAAGLIVVGSTAGNVQLTAAQFTGAAVTTEVDAGTLLVLNRLS